MKSKRAALNILSNMVLKLSTLIFGIIIPKLYIDHFGSEINGLLSSLMGIFVYINLLEAGVGGASIQALYAPISQNKQDEINGILSATNKYYKRTGVYFLACISILAFLYPLMAKSTIAYINVVFLVLLSSISSALSYFFLGKYIVLLNADNRGYVISIFYMVFITASNIAKIVLILLGYNIFAVQIVVSGINVLQTLALFVYVKKSYPKLDLSVQPDITSISKKNSVIIHQISAVIFNNTDVLLLTFFCNLKIVSVYVIYNMIYSQAIYLPSFFAYGLTAGLGQVYYENKKRFKELFNFFEVYYVALVFVVLLVAFLLIIPFIGIYMAGVTDIDYIDNKLPVLFLAVFLLSTARVPAGIVVDIAGHFKQTRWRSTLETTINLIVSITLVNIIGIYGVLLGTITALLYRTFDLLIYSSRYLLQRSSFIPIIRWILNIGIGVFIVIIYSRLNIQIFSYFKLILVGCLLFIASSILYFGMATLIEKKARLVLFEYRNILFKRIMIRKKVI